MKTPNSGVLFFILMDPPSDIRPIHSSPMFKEWDSLAEEFCPLGALAESWIVELLAWGAPSIKMQPRIKIWREAIRDGTLMLLLLWRSTQVLILAPRDWGYAGVYQQQSYVKVTSEPPGSCGMLVVVIAKTWILNRCANSALIALGYW